MYSDGIELSRDVIEFVAYNINSNVRELEGALISLLAQSSLNNKEVDLDLAKKIIKNFVKSVSREVSIDYIQKTVCEFFEVPQEQLKEKHASVPLFKHVNYQCSLRRVILKTPQGYWKALWWQRSQYSDSFLPSGSKPYRYRP